MSAIRAFLCRVGGLFGRQRKDLELREELESHLQLQMEDNIRSGMTFEEARRDALIKSGGLEVAREACRDRRGLPILETAMRDLRHSLRVLRRSPAFTAVAVITLALGIGANTTLFSVIHAVLLRPLPYREPGQLFNVRDQSSVDAGDARLLSVPELFDLRERQRTLEGIGAFQSGMANLMLADGAARLGLARVTADMFPLLGVQPVLGRAFAESEEQAGADRVVVLSHGLWRSQFGGSRDVLGQTIRLNGEGHTVIGVMPAGFAYPYAGVALWKPLALGSRSQASRGNHGLFTLTRLKPGVSWRQAEQDLHRVRQAVEAEQPGAYPALDREKFGLTSLLEGSVGDVRRPLLILMAGALLVLLLACVNVANLLLVRASVRQKEMSLRLALGAGRIRVFGQLLVEGALLSGIGGVCGLLLAQLVLRAIVTLAPDGIPRLDEVRIDWLAVLFALATCAVVTVSISLAPALKAFRSRLSDAFTNLASRTEARALLRLREAMVTGQIAVSVLLLVSAGLLLQSFQRLLQDDLGFDTRRLLTFKVYPSAVDYPELGQVDQFYQRLFERIEMLPGVESVGGVSNVPLYDEWNSLGVAVRGIAGPAGEAEARIDIGPRYVRSRYFKTMGIRLLHGRLFDVTDSRSARPTAIVDERFARRFWRNAGEAVGHQMSFPGDADWRTIVGVVRSVKHYGPGVESQPEVYVPQSQSPQRGIFLAVRASVPPENLFPAIRACLAELDARIPIYNLATGESRFAGLVQKPRFIASLLTSFAVLALTLAAVGTFGVVSYSMRQRTREFGIRFALGAQKRDVIQLILGRVGWMAVAGIAVGLGCAVATTRLMTSLLFGVTPLHATTFVTASAAVAVVTLLGGAWPTLLAVRIKPSEALRYE
jgi:predicted permease